MIDGIYAATVYVNDQAAALAWYTEMLGMEVRLDASIAEGIRWLEVAPPGAPTNLLLIHGCGGWSPERVGVDTGVVLTAADVEATFGELSGRGVPFPMPPQQFEWGWNAVFADPDGNTFVLSQSRG